MIKNITLLEFGLFEKIPKKREIELDGSSPTGYFLRADDIKLLKESSKLQISIGSIIGIKYKIKAPKNIIHFQAKILHPKLTNPKNGLTFSKTVEEKCDIGGSINFDFYEFEEEWELVAGEWIFQILENKHLLLEKRFELSLKT